MRNGPSRDLKIPTPSTQTPRVALVLIQFIYGIPCLAMGMRNGPNRDMKIPTPSKQTPRIALVLIPFIYHKYVASKSIQKHSMPNNGYEEWSEPKFEDTYPR